MRGINGQQNRKMLQYLQGSTITPEKPLLCPKCCMPALADVGDFGGHSLRLILGLKSLKAGSNWRSGPTGIFSLVTKAAPLQQQKDVLLGPCRWSLISFINQKQHFHFCPV